MAWSYRNDRADEIYGSANGPAAVTTQKLPRPPTDGEDITTEPPPPVETSSNLIVSGAGSPGVNGSYAYVDANNWSKPSSAFAVKRTTEYPEPGVPWWIMVKDANVFYQAPDCPFPWDAVWEESSFGNPPVPTVTEVTQRKG